MAGFYGGGIDTLLMRLTDIMLAFPGFLLTLAIVAVLGPGLTNAMIAVGIGRFRGLPGWCGAPCCPSARWSM